MTGRSSEFRPLSIQNQIPHRVRVLVRHANEVRHAFDLTFTNTDASAYIALPESYSTYHYGKRTIPPGQQMAEFSIFGELQSTDAPHVSLHQSGQVHIRTNRGPKAGPLFIRPLVDLRGGHVATVTAATFVAFPTFDEEQADDDQVIEVEDGVESGRFAVYVNGESSSFAVAKEHVAFTVSVSNPKVSRPVHVGVAPFAQAPLGPDESGITAIAGFQPDGSGNDLLFLRAL